MKLDLPAVHQDYLVAAMGFAQPQGGEIYALTPLDAPWREVATTSRPSSKPEEGWRCECPTCRREGFPLEQTMMLGSGWRVIRFDYVPLPASIQALGPRARVGYWIAWCRACDCVFWMPDEGQWKSSEAAQERAA